jgi:hypothetical protein
MGICLGAPEVPTSDECSRVYLGPTARVRLVAIDLSSVDRCRHAHTRCQCRHCEPLMFNSPMFNSPM